MSTATTAQAGHREVPHYAILMGCTMIATLMQALDNTIANIVLPHMQGSLSASRDQITWVLTSYIIAAAIMTAPTGWLSDRFGRKNFFLVCLFGFTLASAACGLAQSLPQMVAFRFLQGCFGAGLLPLSQALILDITPEHKRGSAMAIWGIGVMVGPIMGPTLGGWLTDTLSWRWCFYINVPFGIATFFGLSLFLHEEERIKQLRFDFFGFGALSVALAAFQLMLDRGSDQDWFNSNEILLEAAVAATALYLFIVHMFTAENTFIPRRIFADVGFLTGFVVMFVLGSVIFSSSALMAPYLQQLSGYSVTQAGLLMMPRGFGTMFAMMVSAQMRKMDPRIVVGSGILLMGLPMLDMSTWTPDIGWLRMTVVTVIQGVGMGFVFLSMQMVGFATLEPSLRTNAAALYALIRSIGGAIGISITSVMLAHWVQVNHSQMAEHVTTINRNMNMITPGSMGGVMYSPQTQFGAGIVNGVINHQAAIIAYANDFKLIFWMTMPTLLLLLLMRKPKAMTAEQALEQKEEMHLD